ncbi:hypothetical protein FKP32DRAFT_822757 [Trametes sanguinea]|nr:hypothetical protein FKP32DRAFT_822757 [Trametes sanguinea]
MRALRPRTDAESLDAPCERLTRRLTAGQRPGGWTRMVECAGCTLLFCLSSTVSPSSTSCTPSFSLFSSSFLLALVVPLAMVFSFSFSLSVPGITNPFTAPANPVQAPPPTDNTLHYESDVLHASVPRRRPPSPSLLPPLSRKRGWVPSSAEPSRPASMHTSTSGYLDTPAKYRDMAYQQSAEQDEVEEMVAVRMLKSYRPAEDVTRDGFIPCNLFTIRSAISYAL